MKGRSLLKGCCLPVTGVKLGGSVLSMTSLRLSAASWNTVRNSPNAPG